MSIYEFEGKRPIIGKGTYVFDSADVIGDVVLGEGVYIGAGARLRGDYGTIHIGDGSAVEDNVVIHARPNEATHIGRNVTIGHGAVIHNCTIKDGCVIGMNSVVSDWAQLGEWCVVGEGAVVRNKQVLEPDTVVVGVPAKPIAKVDDDYKRQWTEFKGIYTGFARSRYPGSLKKIG